MAVDLQGDKLEYAEEKSAEVLQILSESEVWLRSTVESLKLAV